MGECGLPSRHDSRPDPAAQPGARTGADGERSRTRPTYPGDSGGTGMMRLERTMLFVPATRRHMVEKAAASAADAVCIDLEDSVAVDGKPAARASAASALREIDFGSRIRML